MREGVSRSVTGAARGQAEHFFVESFEEWRVAAEVPTPFTFVGHSLGAYLGVCYALVSPPQLAVS